MVQLNLEEQVTQPAIKASQVRHTDPLMAYPLAHTHRPLASTKLLAVSQTKQVLELLQLRQPARKMLQLQQLLL